MEDRAEALASQTPKEDIAAAFADNSEAAEGQAEPQESDATEEQAPEGQPADEAKGELPSEYAEALKTFQDAEGQVDLGKLAKSYIEAQKLVGKTAKERERLNRLPEYEQKARLADDITRLANAHPDVALAIQTAAARERGFAPPPAQVQQQQNVQPEQTRQRVTELMTAGHIDEAVSLAVELSPAYQRVMQMDAEHKAAEVRRSQDEQRQTLAREVSDFKRKYTGVVWDDAGAVKDHELYDKIVNDTVRRTATYEDALKLAAYELGRVPTSKPDKPDPAKVQAMNQPKGAKPKPKARSNEILLGMDEETFLSKLK